MMFATPGSASELGHRLSRSAATQIAKNWWVPLLNGLALMVAGVLVFSIDWTVQSLATFIGALFIFEGISYALVPGIDARVRRANVVSGLLSIATGIAIIAWPEPGIVAVAIFLGAWLIVSGTIAVSGAFAARPVLPYWWLLLLFGLLEIPLGVLALANPGATLAAIITVAGIWAVAIGVMRVVLAFEIKRLPDSVEEAFAAPALNGVAHDHASAAAHT
jgi:uncharacterized membrane protein HdeD (DUF308 family)